MYNERLSHSIQLIALRRCFHRKVYFGANLSEFKNISYNVFLKKTARRLELSSETRSEENRENTSNALVGQTKLEFFVL